jgi:hypothetical protein
MTTAGRTVIVNRRTCFVSDPNDKPLDQAKGAGMIAGLFRFSAESLPLHNLGPGPLPRFFSWPVPMMIRHLCAAPIQEQPSMARIVNRSIGPYQPGAAYP